MKKIISLILVLGLCLCLFAACGGDEPEDVGGSITPVNTPTPEPEDKPESTPEQPAETPEAPAVEDSFSAGVTIGGTYTNEFIGISCTLDSNWMFFDEAQIAELNGMTIDAINDESLKNQLESSGVIYDMYAMALDSSASINITMESLGKIYGTLLSESDYIDIALESIPGALESMGMTNISCEKAEFDFAGSKHPGLVISGLVDGIAIYENLVCIKAGDYMAGVTIASYVTDNCAAILDCFSAT